MAVPAHDERDFEFAKKYDLEIRKVVASQSEVESDICDSLDSLPMIDSNGMLFDLENYQNSPFEDLLKVHSRIAQNILIEKAESE